MNRRRFNLFLAAGMLGLPRRLRADTPPEPSAILLPPAPEEVPLEHWRLAQNSTWRWFEQSKLVDGEWRLTATTPPVHRKTGEPKAGVDGYLEESAVPKPLLESEESGMTDFCIATEGAAAGPAATAGRRSRDGRPPSHWLRGLSTEELRWWLAHVEPPEAGVAGMTFFEHLTEGHGFDPDRVESLTIDEQAKLHGAAHHGY